MATSAHVGHLVERPAVVPAGREVAPPQLYAQQEDARRVPKARGRSRPSPHHFPHMSRDVNTCRWSSRWRPSRVRIGSCVAVVGVRRASSVSRRGRTEARRPARRSIRVRIRARNNMEVSPVCQVQPTEKPRTRGRERPGLGPVFAGSSPRPPAKPVTPVRIGSRGAGPRPAPAPVRPGPPRWTHQANYSGLFRVGS